MESAEHVSWVRDHYGSLLRQHDRSHLVVDWAVEDEQRLRFSILADIGDVREASILDVAAALAIWRVGSKSVILQALTRASTSCRKWWSEPGGRIRN
jgi:hypothetical protein